MMSSVRLKLVTPPTSSVSHSFSPLVVMRGWVVSLLPTAVNDLRKVLAALRSLVHWFNLGLELGLHHSTLECIQQEQRERVGDCRREMLTAWLRQRDKVLEVGVPSWRVLETALRRMGEIEIAEELCREL